MSDRKDILKSISKGGKPKDASGLIYTCNCGWLDLGHMSSPREPRIEIGATNLWRQISNELGEKKENGFIIKYAQDHGGGDGKAKHGIGKYFGSHESYWIKSNLTLKEKKTVALAIFKEVSVKFETVQNTIMSPVTNSGFSQEDLVSDLIGFYIAVGEISREKVLELCYSTSSKTAFAMWDKYGAVGKNKNASWRPKFNKVESIIEGEEKCDCSEQKNTFPKELTTIKAAHKGILFKDYDIKDSIEDIYNTAKNNINKTIDNIEDTVEGAIVDGIEKIKDNIINNSKEAIDGFLKGTPKL